jgi:CHAT domain-containing protein
MKRISESPANPAIPSTPLRIATALFLALLALVVVLGSPSCVSGNSPSAIDSLLNQAYAENRTIPLRITGGKAGPLKEHPEVVLSRFSRPSLIQVEAMLAGNFQKHTDNSLWWDMQGRAQLLDNDLYSAEQSLIRARELDPHSVIILLDLGVTYFQIAEAGASQKYSDALDTLGVALEQEPANPIALFDRAIVEERIYCFGQAAEDWKHYFQLKNEPEWRQEALQHRDRVNRQLMQHESFMQAGLLSPQQLAFGRKEELIPSVDHLIEEYVDLAVRKWLPKASSSLSPDSGAALMALHRLAEELNSRHRDPWLSDLLKLNPRRAATAIQLLARSSQANVDGETDGAVRLATEARRDFVILHSNAGEIRSVLEEMWASRMAVDSETCLKLVATMKALMRGHRYYLLQSQMYLEESTCLLRNRDQHGAALALNRAAKVTLAGEFAAQALNVTNYRASMDRIQGNQYEAWLKSLSALQEFWQGTFPDKRAYSFYAKLADSAEEQRQWNAFFSLQQEAVRSIDATDLIYYQALAHSRLAEAAGRVGNNDVAGLEISRSESLFAQMHITPSPPPYRTEVEINRAKLDAALGNYSYALARLEALRSSAEKIQSYLIKFNFHMTAASIREAQKETSAATDDYRKAAQLAATVVRSVIDKREKLQWGRGMEEAYRGLARCLFAEGKSMEAFEVWEEYRSSSFNARQGPEDRIASLSNRVPADQIFVAYFLKKDGLIIWTLTAKGITADFVHLDEKDIARMTSKLYLLCSDRNSNLRELRKYSSQIYRWMIKPIEGLMRGKHRVVFELDDQLGSVPFEVLADDGDKYLIERFLISYSPGIAHNFDRQRARFDVLRANPLIVANPTIPASERLALVPLTETETEAQRLADLFPHSTLLKEGDATPSRVENLLPQATVFHFAAHSIFESGQLKLLLTPEKGSESSVWDLSHVAAEKLRSCRLVVLSACSTQGRGGAELHDPVNPVASLLAAGVTQVVASRWMVDSSYTSQFMEQFYLQLKQGNEPESALQAAAVAISAKDNHPYYWAAFSLFGVAPTLAKENGNAH